MKIIFIFLLATTIGCSQKNSDGNKIQTHIQSNSKKRSDIELAKLLVENDFLKYVDKSNEKLLRQQIIDSFMIYDVETYRFAHIDAEELAEFSFDFFVPQLKTMLDKRNIKLDIVKSQVTANSNEILINGKRIDLYNENQLQNDDFWTIASQNFFQGLNQLLRDNGSDEKFYLLYSGNDLSTFLLTQKQLQLIQEKYQNDKNEIPYLP